MEERIKEETSGRRPDQITRLNLDNIGLCSRLHGFTNEFVNLRHVSLNGCGLASLDGFPRLPRLKKLSLEGNKISGGLQVLRSCERLSSLNLSRNEVKDLTVLRDLKDLPNLRELDLHHNEIQSLPDYRNRVFHFLPRLIYLDGSDRFGRELEFDESDEEKAQWT